MLSVKAVVLIQKAWRHAESSRMTRMKQRVRDMCECVVCRDECVQVIRCSNGHTSCVGCAMASQDSRCPMCREPRSNTVDTLLVDVLRWSNTRLRCNTCGTMHTYDRCEQHRAWCPEHRFVCPWGTCNQSFRSRDLVQHMSHHSDVGHLKASPEDYHCVVVFFRTGDTVILCTTSAVVVLHVGPNRRFSTVCGSSVVNECFQLSLRAYYLGPDAAPLVATVRQLGVHDSERPECWLEEHRMGVVPPMLASREGVVLATHTPVLVPRTLGSYSNVDTTRILVDERPGCTLRDKLRGMGVRDLPMVRRPFDPVPESCVPTTVLHIVLREERTQRISDLYDW